MGKTVMTRSRIKIGESREKEEEFYMLIYKKQKVKYCITAHKREVKNVGYVG